MPGGSYGDSTYRIQNPTGKKYEASETEDISQIKEALAKESTAAMAETTKKNTTKKGKKGAIDVKDGTYKGSANGYGGKVTVNVTVSKKTMTAIDIVSAPGETDSFFNRAKGVIDEMLTAQSTDVDVVSGATYSSNGIIGAVKNALLERSLIMRQQRTQVMQLVRLRVFLK